jgi:ABC-type branched-subunit amino acid transport system ATPase component
MALEIAKRAYVLKAGLVQTELDTKAISNTDALASLYLGS